jgi:hypothetical protein
MMKKNKQVFDGKGNYFDCLHFVWQGTEFEVRVTNEVDDIPHDKLRLEVWTVLYEDDDVGNPDKLLGFDDFVKEKMLDMNGLKIVKRKKETEDE